MEAPVIPRAVDGSVTRRFWQHPAGGGLLAGIGLGCAMLAVALATGRLVLPGRDAVFELRQSRKSAIVRAVESAHRSVVTIRAEGGRRESSPVDDLLWLPFNVGRDGDYHWVGSGFFIGTGGFILTNDHVVEGAEHLVVSVGDASQGMSLTAERVGSAPQFDLALLQVDPLAADASGALGAPQSQFVPARLGDSDDLMVGEWAIAIGSPFGAELGSLDPSVSVGVISAVRRDLPPTDPVQTLGPYLEMIQTDAAINEGNSGGPLVNANGEVVGVNAVNFSTVRQGSTGIHFAIPINTAKWVAAELRQYGAVRKPWIGWSVSEIDPEVQARLQVPEDQGTLRVTQIVPGSPADQAGIRVDDWLTSIRGLDPYSKARAERILFGTSADSDVPVEVLRDGHLRRAVIHVIEDPQSRADREARGAPRTR